MAMRDPSQLLDCLDENQRDVAAHPLGPMCVRAGAGTGKTRAITYRIAYGVATNQYTPTNVMAVTFTQRAAVEMSTRLQTIGVDRVAARTFHSAALRQLRFFWPTAVGGPFPELSARKASQVTAAASRLGIRIDTDRIRDLSQEIEWAAVSLVGDAEYPETVARLGRAVPAELDAHTMAKLLRVYQDTKSERGIIDFEDVLTLTCGMLEERPDIAAQIRQQYRHFVVDEYQDVSPLQARLLSLWLGDRRDICVVGDAAQTIYSFTGATERYLREFTTTYPEARVVELNRDYRSTPQIVSLANHLMSRAASTQSVHLRAIPESGPAVGFASYSDDEEEATQVAAQIGDLIRSGVAPSQIAILFRINAQSAAFEDALQRAGIGFVVHGGQKFFDREDVRRTVASLQAAARLTPQTTDLADAMRAAAEANGWTATAPERQGAVREKWNYLNALVELAGAREDGEITLAAFAAELLERASAQAAPEIDGVMLSSLHSAKGLEWEAVFLVGFSEGLIPFVRSRSDADMVEEELRLAYVGVTRAKRHLRISYARARTPGRRGNRKVSRFLTRVWPEVGRARSRPKRTRATSGNETQRFLGDATPEDAALFETLRSWRAQVAKQVGLPAYIIATDTALRDIAQARPRTLKHLGMLRGIGPAKLETFGAPILALVAGGELDAEVTRAAAAWASRDTSPENGS
ncbi:ATP-dependent DNA helicase UvrD2 [Nanchangia anserum]|uniref:DNA 3'-5' helicase n=1 Tax=Nanchangia anserum TaxID=2692125 RepID=A0A8I0G870_9ACTO|nr:ATP-dependent DNA helicase UvrD2 [Nanchangia anserum]MBD3688934.1 ATP-dependent DNA helicase UvrD2 [Nanchangia anserum]QOX81200.1 ATP-dependent DNA helicase UvrD2 [Nanchangia anserum]